MFLAVNLTIIEKSSVGPWFGERSAGLALLARWEPWPPHSCVDPVFAALWTWRPCRRGVLREGPAWGLKQRLLWEEALKTKPRSKPAGCALCVLWKSRLLVFVSGHLGSTGVWASKCSWNILVPTYPDLWFPWFEFRLRGWGSHPGSVSSAGRAALQGSLPGRLGEAQGTLQLASRFVLTREPR